MPEPFPLSLPFSCCPENSSLTALTAWRLLHGRRYPWVPVHGIPMCLPTAPLGQRRAHRPTAAWQKSCLSCGQRGDPLPAPLLAEALPRHGVRAASLTWEVQKR